MWYKQKLYNFLKKLKDVELPNILYRLTISDANKFKIIKIDITQTEWNLTENWKKSVYLGRQNLKTLRATHCNAYNFCPVFLLHSDKHVLSLYR